MRRIDVIGQNGNEGEHYEVIDTAKELALNICGDETRYREFISIAFDIVSPPPCPYSTLTGEEE